MEPCTYLDAFILITGVSSVGVNLTSGKIIVHYDAGQVSVIKIRSLIGQNGFSVVLDMAHDQLKGKQ